MNKSYSPPSIVQSLSDAAREKRIPHKHVVIWHLVIIQWPDIRLHTLHYAVRVTEVEVFGKVHS